MPLEAAERRVEQALRLLVAAEVGTSAAAERARALLIRWRGRSPEHENAYREAQRRWGALAAVSMQLRGQFAEPAAAPRSAGRLRGAGLIALLLMLCAGLTGGWQRWQDAQPLWTQDYATVTAQVMSAKLPDGSRLDLNARTRLKVTLYRKRREVELLGGEARFEVARDPARPFQVGTRQGTITVLGTAFTVADRGAVRIAVEHGHVRFQPGRGEAAAGRAAIDLHGGQALGIQDGQAQALQQVDAADVAAWRAGWLVFNDVPLSEALPAINAFRQRPLAAASPAVERLHLTGRFRAADQAALLTALPAILPLRVQRLPDGSERLLERRD